MEEYAYLHPLGVGELLDRAIRLYRKNFPTATWIAAAMGLPVLALRLIIPVNLVSVSNLLSIPLYFIETSALIYLFGQIYLFREAAFKDSLAIGWKRFWTIFWASFIRGIVIVIPVGILAILLGLVRYGIPIFIIIAAPILIYIGARWSITDCAIILEGLGTNKSLSRSWNLTKLSLWRVIGITLAIGALTWLFAGLPTIFFNYFSKFLKSDISPQLLSAIGSAIGTLGTIITYPLNMATHVVLFYDLRIRHEGFDLFMRAQPETTEEVPASE